MTLETAAPKPQRTPGVLRRMERRLTRRAALERASAKRRKNYGGDGMESMAQEEWRPVPGYEGLYSISDAGRLVRHTRKGDRPKRPVVNPYGYLKTQLCKGNVRRDVTMHGLVAAAFLGPCPDGQEVNHKDADKQNNRPENLEYVTVAENRAHAVLMGLQSRGERVGTAKLTDASVLAIRAQRGRTKVAVLVEEYGVSRNSITNIWSGKTWTHLPMTPAPQVLCGGCGKLLQPRPRAVPVGFCQPCNGLRYKALKALA